MLYGLKALDTVHLHEQKKSRCHTPPLEPTPLTWSPCRPDCWGCAIQGRETCYAPLIVVKSTVSSLFFKHFISEYSWFNNIVTVSKRTAKGLSHTQTCIHSPPNSPPIQAATWHWAEFLVLYSRTVLVFHFNTAVCTCPSQILWLSLPSLLPLLATTVYCFLLIHYGSLSSEKEVA